MFKNSVSTSKKTYRLSITKIGPLILGDKITVSCDKRTEHFVGEMKRYREIIQNCISEVHIANTRLLYEIQVSRG
jgi:hypothetical protein